MCIRDRSKSPPTLVVAAVVSLLASRGRWAVTSLSVRFWVAPPFKGVHRCRQARDRRSPGLLVVCLHTAAWTRPTCVHRGLGWECGWWVLLPSSCWLHVLRLGLEIIERKLRGPLGLVHAGDGVRVRFKIKVRTIMNSNYGRYNRFFYGSC